MVKTFFRELIITILLVAAILLILSVLLYNYNPMNKVVPNKVEQYTLPENTLQELENDEITELETTNIVYTIQGSDLNAYINNKNYVQGKANPFATTSSSATGTPSGSTTSEGENKNNESGSNTGTTQQSPSTGSDGTFWNSTKDK